ncbi:MAG: MerR family transcriptional regulator [Saprospiraceae bacterium]|nr:MerR family transcriptional regulator [Saprospiraceae bacterium]MBK9726775.1 MerR family transcriptional regulator [Saprospiraceae bacterium]
MNRDANMAIYTIADLEMLTGIKAHTIRIWEKRYGLINPKRTQTNIRFYDEEDLKKLANIALLNHKGYKISLISEMQVQEIESLVANISDVEVFNKDALDALSLSILQLNEKNFTHLVNTNIHQLGFENTFNQILMPLLDKLNNMWLSGSIKKVHEEFVNRFIKKKIIHELCHLENQEHEINTCFLLFLPPEEKQELNLYFVELFIRKNNFRTIDLGFDLTVSDILDGIQIIKPQFLFSIVHEESSISFVEDLINGISEMEDPPILLLTGYYSNHFRDQSKFVRITEGFEELEQFIKTVKEISCFCKK